MEETFELEGRPRFGERAIAFCLSVLGTIILPLVAVLALLTYRSIFLVWLGVGVATWLLIGRTWIGVSFPHWFALYFAVTWLAAILVCVIHDRSFAKL